MDKFPSAIFKKFATEEDALAFVTGQAKQTCTGRSEGNIKPIVFLLDSYFFYRPSLSKMLYNFHYLLV